MWTWLPGVLSGAGAVLVIVGCAAVVLLARRRKRALPAVLVANTDAIFATRAFRNAARSYRTLLVLGLVVALGGIGFTSILSARVITTERVTPETRSRDIVLCLDVSGSMKSFNRDLLSRFDDLAQRFRGERVSLVLFDSSPLQVFPLTSDYGYAHEQFSAVRASLQGQGEYAYRDGTKVGDGSSLVSDGLAGCVLQFDRVGEVRSRTVVFATDYKSVGESLVTIDDALALAKERKVVVHGFNPSRSTRNDEAIAFEQDIVSTGGMYFATRSDTDALGGIEKIVAAVTSDPATVVLGSPVLTTREKPEIWIWTVAGFVGLLYFLMWRLRL